MLLLRQKASRRSQGLLLHRTPHRLLLLLHLLLHLLLMLSGQGGHAAGGQGSQVWAESRYACGQHAVLLGGGYRHL